MTTLQELLQRRPLPGGVLLHRGPVAASEEDHLVRQVIALANADVESPRCVVFGAESAPAGAISVIGLGAEDPIRISKLLQLCAAAIEPSLQLKLAGAAVAGKRLAAIMIGNHAEPPYMATGRGPATLRTGECWLFDARGMRLATRSDLDNLYARRRQPAENAVKVGLGTNPNCDSGDVVVPVADNPPSRVTAGKLRSAIAARKTVSSIMGRDDTAIGRLADARIFGADAPYRQQGMDTLARSLQSVAEDFHEADLHYRFEERAVQLNFSIFNGSPEMLREAVVEIAMPSVAGVAAATRLYCAPGTVAARNYPQVSQDGKSIRARAVLGSLTPGSTTMAFGAPLRLAVDRALAGHKMAIHYALGASNLPEPLRGRLRVRFV